MRKFLALAALCGYLCGSAAQADLAPFNPDDSRFKNRPQPSEPKQQPDKSKSKEKPKEDKKKGK